MPKPTHIELADAGLSIPILYEDRSAMAVDKPAGWMLAPDTWDQTGRNLQLALQSSLSAGDFWARSRNLKYLRYVHRLDAETTGVLLLAKSSGALRSYTELFETREVEKRYLAVVHGVPKEANWTCALPLAPDPGIKGRMRVVTGEKLPRDLALATAEEERDAETHFRMVLPLVNSAVIEARPTTGRTHQIRVHLAAAGHPILGDAMYGIDPVASSKGRQRIALRAIWLAYRDPFQRRLIRISAPIAEFAREYGFDQQKYYN